MGYSSTLPVSVYQWTPAATGNDRAVGFGCIRRQEAKALIQECTYLRNRCVFMLSIALKPLSFLISLQLDTYNVLPSLSALMISVNLQGMSLLPQVPQVSGL